MPAPKDKKDDFSVLHELSNIWRRSSCIIRDLTILGRQRDGCINFCFNSCHRYFDFRGAKLKPALLNKNRLYKFVNITPSISFGSYAGTLVNKPWT
jgi:hypothetical protein